jgi:hypothetical protein
MLQVEHSTFLQQMKLRYVRYQELEKTINVPRGTFSIPAVNESFWMLKKKEIDEDL